MVHRVCNRLGYIEKVASTFVIEATTSISRNLSLCHFRNSMIVKFPPMFKEPVINIAVVMALLCEPIMDQNRMQIVWSLFFVLKRLLNLRL